MSIHEYIQSFTNIDKNSRTNKIKLSTTLLSSKNLLDELELNDLSLTEHFKEFQRKYLNVTTEKDSSKSDVSYTTASSEIESSYLTAVEDFEHLKKPNGELENEISFDSGIDEGKKELITRLLQSKANDSFDEEELFPDYPTYPSETQDLLDDIEIEQKQWDEDISEQLMYKDRIFRFFQTMTVDQNHSLKEDFHEGSEQQWCNLAQKGFPVSENTRQYFMNLTDEHFSEFERKESSESIFLR